MSLKLGGEHWGFPAVMLLIFAVVIHLVDVATRLSGAKFGFWHPIIIGYVAIAAFAAMILGGKTINLLDARIGSEKYGQRFLKYLAISVVAYAIPFINYLSIFDFPTFLGTSLKVIIGGIIIFAPVWVIYIMFLEPTKLTSMIGGLYLIFWIAIILLTYWQPISEQTQDAEIPGVMPGLTVGIVVQKVILGMTNMLMGIGSYKETVTQSIMDAYVFSKTGIDPKEARVDAAKTRNPGVYMQKIRAASSKFYPDSPVTVYATVKAEALEEPVELTVECTSQEEPGKVFPRDVFNIETSEILDIDCLFDPGQLEKGPHDITLTTDFNFETISYLETFYMGEETLRELQKKQIDPLAGQPQPQATTSKGPVNINIKTPIAPIPTKEGERFTVSATILNTGGGEIEQINDFIIFIPAGLGIAEEVDPREIYTKISCDQLSGEDLKVCDPEITNVYKVSASELEKKQYQNIRTGREFRMYLEIEDEKQVLGDAILKPGSFHTAMKYDYELKQKISIQIQEPI